MTEVSLTMFGYRQAPLVPVGVKVSFLSFGPDPWAIITNGNGPLPDGIDMVPFNCKFPELKVVSVCAIDVIDQQKIKAVKIDCIVFITEDRFECKVIGALILKR